MYVKAVKAKHIVSYDKKTIPFFDIWLNDHPINIFYSYIFKCKDIFSRI